MGRERTIGDAVEIVLSDSDRPKNYIEIYNEIIKRNLYQFRTKTPEHVLHTEIRRQCKGINFPSAYPVKRFQLSYVKEGKNYYTLLKKEGGNQIEKTKNAKQDILEFKDKCLHVERMEDIYQNYLKDLKKLLLNRINSCHYLIFEKMIVDLLLAMGYGQDDKSVKIAGKSCDTGIDGLIQEDELGLSLIYVHAKRCNNENKIEGSEIQQFSGAMRCSDKGIFITTSKFTKKAQEYAQADKVNRIRLIDGDDLVELMMKYQIGLENIKEYVVCRINEDYFRN